MYQLPANCIDWIMTLFFLLAKELMEYFHFLTTDFHETWKNLMFLDCFYSPPFSQEVGNCLEGLCVIGNKSLNGLCQQ